MGRLRRKQSHANATWSTYRNVHLGNGQKKEVPTNQVDQALIESPCYLGASGIQTYLADPTVKFILTERSTESWVKSISGSLITYFVKFNRFPLCIVRYCDRFVWELERMFRLMTIRWSGGLDPREAAFEATIARSYEE